MGSRFVCRGRDCESGFDRLVTVLVEEEQFLVTGVQRSMRLAVGARHN